MLIEWCLEIGFAGCTHEGEIDVDENATDEEIEEIVKEEAFNCIELGWSKVKESD